jgi:hypothetical protein
MPATKTKRQVKYRPAHTFKRCGDCIMFRRGTVTNECTLVKGAINSQYVCDEWEGRKKG